jgi:GNAT superfamily N-acetyltransferase
MAGDSQVKGLVIYEAASAADIEHARELFLEYAQSLGFSLCFQNYAPPRGRLLLANYDSELAGCVALHPLEENIAEMKRLYVRPQFRGKRLGFALVQQLLAMARELGYHTIRLDTVEPVMKDAVKMYRRLGFRDIPPYRTNPMKGALYMQLDL